MKSPPTAVKRTRSVLPGVSNGFSCARLRARRPSIERGGPDHRCSRAKSFKSHGIHAILPDATRNVGCPAKTFQISDFRLAKASLR
jgi:hypothetical protein